MLRRPLLVPILLLALGASAVAQPKKVARVGYLAAVTATADAPRLEAFRQGLQELGYVEGQTIVIEYRHEGGGFEDCRSSPPSWCARSRTSWSRSRRTPRSP